MTKDPKVWGPYLWNVLHALTFKYEPSKDRTSYKRLFTYHLFNMLPCKPCRQNFRRHIESYPIKLDTRESLSRWLVKIHNIINATLEKKKIKYEVVEKRYKKMKVKETISAFLNFENILKNTIGDSSIHAHQSNTTFISLFFDKF